MRRAPLSLDCVLDTLHTEHSTLSLCTEHCTHRTEHVSYSFSSLVSRPALHLSPCSFLLFLPSFLHFSSHSSPLPVLFILPSFLPFIHPPFHPFINSSLTHTQREKRMYQRPAVTQRISYVLRKDENRNAHLLGVNALALDTSTLTAFTPDSASHHHHHHHKHSLPGGILYTGGRDGMIAAWDLHLEVPTFFLMHLHGKRQ